MNIVYKINPLLHYKEMQTSGILARIKLYKLLHKGSPLLMSLTTSKETEHYVRF